jgi:hypothetical protein
MACKTCGAPSNKTRVVTKVGPPGPRGPAGRNGANGTNGTNATAIINVDNTVYVMKNGNDATGLVERFDKPFLTIAAARTAALAAFPVRTQSARVKIVVESGNWNEGIVFDDFIDYDLGNSVITAPAATHCMTTNGSAYTACTKGAFTSIVYGSAKFYSSNALHGGLSIMSLNDTNFRLLLHCDGIYSDFYEAIIMGTGFALIYANFITNNNSGSALYQVINLATDNTYSVTPSLEIHGAKIYSNQVESTNSCIEFSNANPTLNTNNSKVMLVNCEVGSWSTTRPAINGDHTGTGRGQLTLKNTLIVSNNASISDDSAPSILKIYAYNSFVKTAPSFVNVSSAFVVGTVTVSEFILFNQGNTIP